MRLDGIERKRRGGFEMAAASDRSSANTFPLSAGLVACGNNGLGPASKGCWWLWDDISSHGHTRRPLLDELDRKRGGYEDEVAKEKGEALSQVAHCLPISPPSAPRASLRLSIAKVLLQVFLLYSIFSFYSCSTVTTTILTRTISI